MRIVVGQLEGWAWSEWRRASEILVMVSLLYSPGDLCSAVG